MSPGTKRSIWREIGVQLPFLLWLIVLWMMLWGQFTALSFVTGVAAALFVTRVFRLPTIELSGRINVWWAAVLVVQFLAAVVHGSLSVAWQVLDPRRAPGAAIIAVPLRYADDLVMTHVAVTASLIPGSFVVEADRDRRTLYLHVIGVRSLGDVERQRADVLRWERRIVRALGSPAQAAALRADQRAGASAGAAFAGSGRSDGSGRSHRSPGEGER
ncbi:MAG: Na+/H+ antiporter subunit E [Actinobacteria bacterium]|nr:Na+/H+ antiporter subunit E [Actinomycetota bacterium]